LFHLEGVTPEAKAHGPKLAKAAKQRSVVKSLASGRRALNSGKGKIDVVAVGCPHASPDD